jgi:cytochrome c556
MGPVTASAELRPLVREMLDNLHSVDEVGQGVALDDFERSKRAAAELEARAGRMLSFDLSRLGVDISRDGEFDALLRAQQQAARAIGKAAAGQDGAGVMAGLDRLVRDACLGCHESFRERENLLRPSVLFMTSFLRAWEDINRGLMTNDLELVARRAYEIQAIGRVLTWDQVIMATFQLTDPGDRGEFREFVRSMTSQASRIEKAANEDELQAIAEAGRRMWTEGCIACHEQFRE